mmetsp:Transcript_21977/g.61467  ORF Transcript_21977/g.61467 Transcript_21977/m.61467 type:complete len:298 (+) Transcript_21977:109-1002(+)
MASAPPAEGTDAMPELHTCTGIGWVTFDRGDAASAGAPEAAYRVPHLRCVGAQRSRQLTTAAGRRPGNGLADTCAAVPDGAATSNAAAALSVVARGAAAAGFGEVSDETWALGCAGRLSMITLNSAATVTAGSSFGAIESTGSADRAEGGGAAIASQRPVVMPWGPCHVRCSGLTLRFESDVEGSMSAPEAARPKDARLSRHQYPEQEAQGFSPEELVAGVAKAGLAGVELVAGHAHGILATAGGAAWEAGPHRFVLNTTDTAGKICMQAVKIARRSMEQVGHIATLTWRAGRGGDV